MGNMYIVVRGLLEYLDLEVVVPPKSNQKTLDLGVKYGHEFACLPLKVCLGNLIEAYEMGADTMISAGGVGPCRFGLYAQVENNILRDLGYDYDLLVLEPPDKHLGQFLSRLKKIIGNKSWYKVIEAIRFAYQKAYGMDIIEKKVQYLRPREKKVGTVDAVYAHVLDTIYNAMDFHSLKDAISLGLNKLEQIPIDREKEVLKIGLIGEIYTLLEPFVNHDIERELGKLGIEVTRSLYLSEWINNHLLMGLYRNDNPVPYAELAKPYLNHFVGGHGRETIGYAIHFANSGYQGLIQIAPLTCMPEIVAHSILSEIRKEFDIPILTLYVDEQSGKAGILTRLEAFVDLIQRQSEFRRQIK
jgi:predicted nucleotide-binding protein (sugar kinase/HSP70/actin superfamily)